VESIQLFAKKNGEVKLLEIYFIQWEQNQRALFCIFRDQEGFQIEISSACQVGNIIIFCLETLNKLGNNGIKLVTTISFWKLHY